MVNVRQYLTEEVIQPEGIVSMIERNCAPYLKEIEKGFGNKMRFLYRGTTRYIDDIKKMKVRKNRKPTDTDEEVHRLIDQEFKTKHGWYARSEGVFTTGKVSSTIAYGQPYLFFPIGQYKFLWSPKIDDLFSYFEETTEYDNVINDYSSYEEFSEYNNKYSEGEDGHWEYKGENIGHFSRFMEVVSYLVGTGIDIIEKDLTWVPEIEYDEWVSMKAAHAEENFESLLEDTIKTYTNKNLKKAILSDNEVMFKCKEYYLVHPKHKQLIERRRQLPLPLKFH